MTHLRSDLYLDGVQIIRLESEMLRIEIAPSVGGRVVSLVEKPGGYEFLWRNHALPLALQCPGSDYDSHFYGGIDELLPNDVPEVIAGIPCPDHGELWTSALTWKSDGRKLQLEGTLGRFGLKYLREVSLRADCPCIDVNYRITNVSLSPRPFLWKLHAALAVQAGDIIDCPARTAQVVDLNYSRFVTLSPFVWPKIKDVSCNIVSPVDGTVDFFYLFDLSAGRIGWRRPSAGLEFTYEFDPLIFPYAWLFASYGGFKGHYTVILEPCTTMPISVNEAYAVRQCSLLAPGEALETMVSIWAKHHKT